MAKGEEVELQCCHLVVGERPLSIWGVDLGANNQKFLSSLDPSYFHYLIRVHLQSSNQELPTDNQSQHSALALRTAYSQALETLFALLFASVQAPHCVPAWISNYRNHELIDLVQNVQNNKAVDSVLDSETPTWSEIYDTLFNPKENDNGVFNAKGGFVETWKCFASDFLNESFSREYNSIKHGLRISQGGFKLELGLTEEPGVKPPQDKMFTVMSSHFGSSYFKHEKIGELKHHLCLRRESHNWDIDGLHWGIQFAAMSIENIRSSLEAWSKGENNPSFICPENLSDFEKWKGVQTIAGPDITIPSEVIRSFTKEEILAKYRSEKYYDTTPVPRTKEKAQADV